MRDAVELPDFLTHYVVAAFGLPQDWNRDGAGGAERYIEAQVWADEPLRAFLPPRAEAQFIPPGGRGEKKG